MLHTIVGLHVLTSLNDDVQLTYLNGNSNYHVFTRGHTAYSQTLNKCF